MEDELNEKNFTMKNYPKVFFPLTSQPPRFISYFFRVILQNKREHPVFARLLRSKGFF
jgi:hypothetical protein